MAKKFANSFKFAIKAVDRARLSALNRAAKSARAEGVRKAREVYNVKAGDLKEQIRLVRANRERKYALLQAVYKGISLIKFSARPTKRPKKYRTGKIGGTKVTVKKGKRELIPHAFVQTIRGKKGVFIRTDKIRQGKETVKKLYGPSAAHILHDKRVTDAIEKKFVEQFKKEFDSKLDYYIKKF